MIVGAETHKIAAHAPGALCKSSAWQALSFASEADRRRFAEAARVSLKLDELNHDVEWLEAGSNADTGDCVVLFASHSDGVPSGVLPVRACKNELKYTVGDTAVIKKRVLEYQVFREPVTSGKDAVAEMANAMSCLAGSMPSGAVVHVSATPIDSAFHSLLTSRDSPVRRHFHVLAWGDDNWHCKIDWTGSVEAYLASLGADSRRNFKRYSKKLFGNDVLQPKIERFRAVEEVGRFLDDGIKVSDKTYQKALLGLGLSRGGAMERRFRFAAERDCFLGHILYLGGEPVAFHYGFVFGGTFFGVQMGYDPAASQHQPGSVLFFHVLEDVERLKLPVTTVDCLPGVTDFKLRTTNRKVHIRNFYLFKRTVRGTLFYGTIRAIDGAVRRIKSLVSRTKWGGKLRRPSKGQTVVSGSGPGKA
jgi:Acetyltransferase (GNAT) domain